MGSSRLPARRSEPLHSRIVATIRSFGAGEGNRTLVVSLEGFCSTIELHPRVRSQKSGVRRQKSKTNRLPSHCRALRMFSRLFDDAGLGSPILLNLLSMSADFCLLIPDS